MPFTGDQSAAQRLMRSPVLAAVYERAWRPFLGWSLMGFDLDHLRREHQLTIDALRLADGDVVLDVACWRDNLHPRAAYVRGDAHHLPFRDHAIDAVNCYAALYLIPGPYTAFEEMLRVLRNPVAGSR